MYIYIYVNLPLPLAPPDQAVPRLHLVPVQQVFAGCLQNTPKLPTNIIPTNIA